MNIKYAFRAFWIDSLNRLKFGPQAPRHAEPIWVHPSECERYIEAADLTACLGARVRRLSGRVVSDWPASLEQPLENHPKLTYCQAHWGEGKTWAESGAIDFMLSRIAVSPTGMTDGCRNRHDVQQRFETLDRIWFEAKERGRVLSYHELHPDNFREYNGILMHLGPGGGPVFSGAGCHRFAIARQLDRPFPAQLGIVHTSALGRLPELRRRP